MIYFQVEITVHMEKYTVNKTEYFNTEPELKDYTQKLLSKYEDRESYEGYDETITPLTDAELRKLITVEKYAELNLEFARLLSAFDSVN